MKYQTSSLGVRQGEKSSPISFAIYFNDFQSSTSISYNGLNELACDVENEIETLMELHVLLYTDDTVVLAESAIELQVAMNELNQYYQKWSLSINATKTKIGIFSNEKVCQCPLFYLGNEEIEVNEDYVYLGIIFSYNGSFKKPLYKQITHDRKALFLLTGKARMLRLPAYIVLELLTPVLCQFYCMELRFGAVITGGIVKFSTVTFYERFWKLSNLHHVVCYTEKAVSTTCRLRLMYGW